MIGILIRDKNLEVETEERKDIHFSMLGEIEYVKQLLLQILGQAANVLSSEGNVGEIVEILELTMSIAHARGIAWGEIEKKRIEKREQKGGFERGYFSTKYGKLVRDNLPETPMYEGEKKYNIVLEKLEHFTSLLHKIVEESLEVLKSEGNVEELADMLEVLRTIVKMKGLTWGEIEAMRIHKKQELGGFEKGIFLEK